LGFGWNMMRQTIIYKVWSIVFGEMVSCHAFIIHLVCQVWDRNVKRPVIFFRRFVKGLFWWIDYFLKSAASNISSSES
jgi:hypothetical protein